MGLSLVARLLSSPIDSMRTAEARKPTAAAPGAVAGAKDVAARGARDSMSVESLPARSTGDPAKGQLPAQSPVGLVGVVQPASFGHHLGRLEKLDDRSMVTSIK